MLNGDINAMGLLVIIVTIKRFCLHNWSTFSDIFNTIHKGTSQSNSMKNHKKYFQLLRKGSKSVLPPCSELASLPTHTQLLAQKYWCFSSNLCQIQLSHHHYHHHHPESTLTLIFHFDPHNWRQLSHTHFNIAAIILIIILTIIIVIIIIIFIIFSKPPHCQIYLLTERGQRNWKNALQFIILIITIMIEMQWGGLQCKILKKGTFIAQKLVKRVLFMYRSTVSAV